MERIREALREGRATEAERLSRVLIREQPGFADAHRELSRALELQGRTGEAAAVLLQVGQRLVHGEAIEEGSAYLRDAVRLDPDSAAAHAALGHALLVDRDYQEAVSHLQRAEALGETSPALRIYLGSALWEAGRWEAAERAFRQALTGSGRSPTALRALGGFLVWRGRHREALPLLGEAVAEDPSSLQPWLDLARAREGTGDVDGAIDAYRRTVEIAPEFAESRYALARLFRQRGETERAAGELAVFERLHAAEQERVYRTTRERARLDAGWEMLRRGELDRAAERFARLGPSVESLTGVAAALSAAGDHAGAASALERAVALAPEDMPLKIKLVRERLRAEGR